MTDYLDVPAGSPSRPRPVRDDGPTMIHAGRTVQSTSKARGCCSDGLCDEGKRLSARFNRVLRSVLSKAGNRIPTDEEWRPVERARRALHRHLNGGR